MATQAVEVAEGTAAPGSDTAAGETQQAAEAQQPEGAPDQPSTPESPSAPETEIPTAPETAPDDAPVTLTDQIDALSDEDFEKLGRVAKTRESVRRSSESETTNAIAQQRRQDFQTGKFDEAIKAAVSIDDGGAVAFDSDAFGKASEGLYSGSVDHAVRVLGGLIDQAIPAEFQVSREEQQSTEKAAAAFNANPLDAGPLVSEWLGTFGRMKFAEGKAEGVADGKKQQVAEQAAASKADGLQDATDKSKAAPGATRTEGTAGRQWKTQVEIDTALATGQLPGDEYDNLRRPADGSKSVYDGLPWQ